ncbi:transcription initiation factor TFIID subunit 4-like [Lynx canadensis]|uniref:transcription initiation factor TFIID subunit 4-like n=1 Tax=Lynx canadensis TaxID=61383 RepID=UPI0011B022E1|nr:transcription initiation factor TFIID subunit 4-like [Lynx canadensis]
MGTGTGVRVKENTSRKDGVGGFKIRLLQRPSEAATLRSQPASGLGEAGSVYTCHEEGGGKKRKPQQSPKLLDSSREGAAGRSSLGAAAAAAAGVPAPAAEEGKAQVRSPQARRAGTVPVPAVPGPAADRCSRPGQGSGRWAGPGPRTLFPPHGWRSEAVALTWLVRGGRDGHGSGARGGTGSPGKDRLVRHGAGESGRQTAHSPVSEAAPWTPTRSFSTVAGPPSHYPPPSSAAAAASTSSSAETPRPLHTLSHHAAGNRRCRHVTSGRRTPTTVASRIIVIVRDDDPREATLQIMSPAECPFYSLLPNLHR